MSDKFYPPDKISLEERLNTRINDLEHDVAKLEHEIQSQKYHDDWQWRQIKELSKEDNGNLPVPRLELRWRHSGDGYNVICDYNLITKHLLGQIILTPLSSTRVGGPGGGEATCQRLDTPFRDGAHILHDAKQLGLPAYVVYKDRNKVLEVK